MKRITQYFPQPLKELNLQTLFSKASYTKKNLLLVGVAAILLALPFIYLAATKDTNLFSNASTLNSVEPETGTLSGTATVVTDATASGGQAVDFGTSASTACTGVQITPGQDIQAAINANPNGTTFCLASGVYRISSALIPKSNQQFVGAQGAVIDGAEVVTGWTVNGSDWVATGFLPGSASTGGTCDPAFPLCGQAQDIFLDGVWLAPVSSRASLATGKAYLDYAANKIYVRDDPTGHTMEQSLAPKLFTGAATGVQIKNLIIQHAASVANTGVIDPASGGTGWILDHNEIRWNHGYGTGPGGAVFGQTSNMTITANNVHHNGQDGTGADGVGNVVQNNEVHHNSYAGYDAGWDAGNKFGHARNLIVSGNYYHDERGPAIWCDINCQNITVTNNYVARSQRGIMFEISCGASIHDNIIVDSIDSVTNGWGGIGILIAESQDVEVYNNATYNGNRGIWAIQSDRTEATDCTGGTEHVVKNLNVHNNNEDLNSANPPFGGKTGLWTDSGRTDIYGAGFNNVFTANTYHQVMSSSQWDWGMNTPPYTPTISFSAWQAAGKDTTGSVVADDPAAPPPPSLVTGPQSSSASGTVIATISVPANGTYRVWSRIMAPDSTSNAYKLQVDNGTPVTVGDAVIPSGTWTWVDYNDGSASSKIDIALTAGSHTLTFIGSEANVKVDRLILITDTTCVPVATGDNCTVVTSTSTPVPPTNTPTPEGGTINTPTPTPTPTPTQALPPTSTPVPQQPTNTPTPRPIATPTPTPIHDTVAPTVSITVLANGATVKKNSNITIQATASDNVAVARVQFLVNGTLVCSDTTSPYTCSWRVPDKKSTTYTITVQAYDATGNAKSASIQVKVQ